MFFAGNRKGTALWVVFLIAAIALLAAACVKSTQSKYRDVSTAPGVGNNPPGFQQNLQGGEEEIPPLTWCDGAVTDISCDPRSFDPVVGQTSSLHVTLSQSAFRLRVRVLNSLNVGVKELNFQSAPQGESIFTWDGTDTADEAVRYSIYVYSVTAFNNQMREIGSGQTEVVTYRPKGGVSMQDADKYRNEDSEFIHSSNEWVAAGLNNPLDGVVVYYDNQPWSLENAASSGVFRSEPFNYTPGQHTVKIRVQPHSTQTYYDLDYTIYLNRIHCTSLQVLLDGDPVEHDFTYFVPDDGETAQVNYALDAAEEDVSFIALQVFEDAEPRIARTESLGSQSSGSHSYSWDGNNDDSLSCPVGKYCLMVIANPDMGASIFSPSGIFITKYINIEEGS
jgi:flagellar hook assembly protein FlgD